MQRRRAIAVLVVSVFGGLAACGGGEEASSPTTEVAPATEATAAETTATTTLAPDTAAPDTTTPDTSTPYTTDPTAPTTDPATTLPAPEPTMFTGDSDSEWCVVAADIEAYDQEFEDVAFGEPAAVEEAVTTMLSKMEAAEQVAPPELDDALAASLEGMRALDESLAAVGYDFLTADLSAIDDDAMTAAGDLIDRYNGEVCGLDIDLDEDDTSGDSGFDPSAGTVREQIIDQFMDLGFTEDEATCIFDRIDFSTLEELDEQAMLAVYESCGISLTRLGELSG